MAIVSVNEKAGARSRINEKGETEYTRQFHVVTSSASVGNLAVRTATGIPRRGNVYATPTEFDTTSVVKEVDAQQDEDNPRKWIVTANYGAPSGDQDQQNENPLLRPAVLTWGFVQAQKAMYKDLDNRPIANSAHEYFDPPPEVDDSRPVLTVSRNEPSFNPAIAIQYQDAINSDGFLGFQPGQAKVAGISATSQTENNFFFWHVTYEFHFRRDGWKLALADLGRNELVNGKRVAIPRRDEQGNKVPDTQVIDPVPLNGQGQELENPTPQSVAGVNFPPFNVYKSLSFSPLGVP